MTLSDDHPHWGTTTRPIDALTTPFLRFAKMEAAGGILLLAGTIAALVWANSPWAENYYALWDTQVTFGFGPFALTGTRHGWINDGLMAIFFFLVGLEIKRGVLIGELSSLRQAAFPLLAAVGGASIPALMRTSRFRTSARNPGIASVGCVAPSITEGPPQFAS